MTAQQIDFKRIILALRSRKYTPEQMGSFMRQYYHKHLKGSEVPVVYADSLTQTLDEASKIFDGTLFSK